MLTFGPEPTIGGNEFPCTPLRNIQYVASASISYSKPFWRVARIARRMASALMRPLARRISISRALLIVRMRSMNGVTSETCSDGKCARK